MDHHSANDIVVPTKVTGELYEVPVTQWQKESETYEVPVEAHNVYEVPVALVPGVDGTDTAA